jgi:hypothetical protein
MAITAQQIITRAYVLSGAVASGKTPTTAESNDALNALNEMLANWAEQGISVPYRTQITLPLVAGQHVYLLGEWEDADDRPLYIQEVWLEDSANNSYPFELIPVETYQRISQKEITSRPTRAWYEPQYPSGRLTMNSIPDQSYSLILWTLLQFTEFTELTTESVLPLSFSRPLRFNLAMELGGELGSPLDPRVIKIADDSFRTIKNANLAKRVPELKTDDALITPGRFDIRTGSSYR